MEKRLEAKQKSNKRKIELTNDDDAGDVTEIVEVKPKIRSANFIPPSVKEKDDGDAEELV